LYPKNPFLVILKDMAVISVRVNMLAANLPCPRQTLGEKTFKLNQQIA
jgi:hypothetical protein